MKSSQSSQESQQGPQKREVLVLANYDNNNPIPRQLPFSVCGAISEVGVVSHSKGYFENGQIVEVEERASGRLTPAAYIR